MEKDRAIEIDLIFEERDRSAGPIRTARRQIDRRREKGEGRRAKPCVHGPAQLRWRFGARRIDSENYKGQGDRKAKIS